MNRRHLLTASVVLPLTLACSDGVACSIVDIDRTDLGRSADAIRGMFRAWWERDKSAFRAYFTELRMDNGELMEAGIAKEIVSGMELTEATFDVFDKFFVNKKFDKAITYVLSTSIGVMVGCVEDSGKKTGGGSCDFMPTLHIFFIEMFGVNPTSIKHVVSQETAYPDLAAFSIGR